MNNETSYRIISKPSYIIFQCPFCHKKVKSDFKDVDFKTDVWSDGAWCDCPYCGKEVELGDYEYN